MATANPNLGAVRGYAGGGLISKLFGKSETVTEKFARQDAEFKAKHPERAPTPAPAAPGLGGIKGMVSGSLKTNLQEREKAAGLKAGGMVKKCVTGGKITGPGGPTDDLVPIMASNGEFMIKASSAKVLGPKVLKALNDVGGKGVEREPGKMAGGGEVDQLAMSNRLMQQRNLQDATAQGLAAIPQDSQKTYAPEIGPSQIEMPQLKAGGMVRKLALGGYTDDERNKPWYSPEYAKAANMSDLNGLELERARRAAGSPGDANDPLKSLILNGTVGASNPATAQANPATAATPAQSTLPTNARGKGYNDPRQVGMTQPNAAPVDEFSNAAIAQRNPGGMVRKVVGADGRTTYSGSNISGDVSFQGADGNALPGRPGGGSMTYGGMSQEQIKSALTNPDGSAWSAGDNAIMAANIRDGVDKYRGTSRDARNDPMNQPMTKDQRAARVQMAEIASRERQTAQAGAREQEQLGMTRTEHVAKMAKEKQIADVQAEYMAAQGDPVKEAAAKRKMLALGLIKESENKFTVVPDFDANGQRIGTTVLDQAGKPLDFKGGQQATPRAEYDKLPKGSTYTGTDGKQYTKG